MRWVGGHGILGVTVWVCCVGRISPNTLCVVMDGDVITKERTYSTNEISTWTNLWFEWEITLSLSHASLSVLVSLCSLESTYCCGTSSLMLKR
jgi:hypothetical protein